MGSELGVHPDSKPGLLLNSVSIWWDCWAAIWTLILSLGILYLILNRKSPVLRVRGLWLSLCAIVLLHLYWIPVQIGLMLGPVMPGNVQFWVMGIYYPCGLSLFHAYNTRFLHVAKRQKKYFHHGSRLVDSAPDLTRPHGLIARFRSLSYDIKLIVIVTIGMLIQIFLTCLMYIISRKWHSSWGIPGTEVHGTPMEQKTEMGRGWEWWPGVALQLIWAWIVAPIVLWKSRKIHDTQGWRVQTIACVIANLPATPMWLIALYVPAMGKVNQYWIPPQWIGASILVIEIFTIFLPCWEVMRSKTLHKETLDTIAQWEFRTKTNSAGKSLASGSSMVETIVSGMKSTTGSVETTSSAESVLTMSALEYVLERNPSPLQEFAALRDFSGENIAFLTSVAEWKNSVPKWMRDNPDLQDEHSRELARERFNRALRIYVEFISVRHAEFPINISFTDLRHLESVFQTPARIMYGEELNVASVTPFDKGAIPLETPVTPASSHGSETAINAGISSAILDRVQYWGDVPDGFDMAVFDSAEKSIKYLVLTNTWPRFIKDLRSPRTSSSSTLEAGQFS